MSSNLTIPSMLNLFEPKYNSVGVTSVRWTELSTESGIDVQPFVFSTFTQRAFLDLSRAYVIMKVRVLNEDGSNLKDGEDNDKVTLANYPLCALIRSVQIHVSGKQLYDSGAHFPYIQYLSHIMSMSGEQQRTILALGGYRKHTSNDTTDKSFLWRASKTNNSKSWEIAGQLVTDLTTHDKCLLPFTDVKFVLFPATPEQALDRRSGTKKYIYKIDDIRILVPEVFVTESLQLSIEQMLRERKMLRYHIASLNLRTFYLKEGQKEFPEMRLGLSRIPRRILVALVNVKSFTGTFGYNPFYFITGNLTNVCVRAGSQVIPYR